MPLRCKEIIEKFEEKVPKEYAEQWDNIGLHIGSLDEKVEKILVSLDVNMEVVDEAIARDIDLIICHHTPIFSAIKNIRWDSYQGLLLKKLIKADISLYCAHTNLDSTFNGINEHLAGLLELENGRVLASNREEKLYKIVTFLPEGYEEAMLEALSEAGCGHLGNYSHASFRSKGYGSFLPLEGADPFIGEKNKIAKVSEYRLETIVEEKNLKEALLTIKKEHPYEEPAYDVYENLLEGKKTGLGWIGDLSEELSLADFISRVKQVLKIENLRYVGDLSKKIKKVALCGGSGMSFLGSALEQGADLFLTADIKYHDAQDALNAGICLIDGGHFSTEVPIIEVLAKFLEAEFENLEVFVSEVNTDPFKFM